MFVFYSLSKWCAWSCSFGECRGGGEGGERKKERDLYVGSVVRFMWVEVGKLIDFQRLSGKGRSGVSSGEFFISGNVSRGSCVLFMARERRPQAVAA